MSLAVGFAMIGSYILSSTFVPVMCVWLLKPEGERHDKPVGKVATRFENVRAWYERQLPRAVAARWLVVAGYLAASLLVLAGAWWLLGRGIFPTVDAGQFRLRMRAADGTHIVRTEQLAKQALDIVAKSWDPRACNCRWVMSA